MEFGGNLNKALHGLHSTKTQARFVPVIAGAKSQSDGASGSVSRSEKRRQRRPGGAVIVTYSSSTSHAYDVCGLRVHIPSLDLSRVLLANTLLVCGLVVALVSSYLTRV